MFSTFNAPGFLGPTLEVLQAQIDEGNEVLYLTCGKSFSSCGFNLFGLKYMCDICNFRFDHAKNEINGKYSLWHLKDLIDDNDYRVANEFMRANPRITKSLQFEGYDVGEAVRSSYISKTRDRDFELTQNEAELSSLAVQSIVVYLSLRRFLVDKKIERVMLFNGRWDYYRALFRAVIEAGIPCTVFENLRPGGFIHFFENSFPHIIQERQKKFDSFWNEEADALKKKDAARKYFEGKRRGEEVVVRSFIGKQVRSHLPDIIKNGKKTIVLFNSSDDEIAAIGGDEFKNPFFSDQIEGILFVADLVGTHLPDFNLVIRMHPNLTGVDFDFLKPVYSLKNKYPNVELVEPESKVDSYALVDAAFKVVTFGTSMGVEANYWRRPVVLLARGFYFYSDLAYIPSSKSEIRELLVANLQPKPIENSEKIAYYMMSGGHKSKYYHYVYKKEYSFKTARLDKLPYLKRNYYRALKLLEIKN